MTERFVVPAEIHCTCVPPCHHRARFDLLSILRAEIAAALAEENLKCVHREELRPDQAAYLTARYGAAPETGIAMKGNCQGVVESQSSGKWACNMPEGTTCQHRNYTAPTFTREAEAWLDALAKEQENAIGFARFKQAVRAYLASREGR